MLGRVTLWDLPRHGRTMENKNNTPTGTRTPDPAMVGTLNESKDNLRLLYLF